MSGCPGLHCPGCGDGKLLAVAATLGGAALAVWLVLAYELIVGLMVGLAVVVSVGVLVWMARNGAQVATGGRPLYLPAPERPALTARPVREVPAAQPQQITNNFYGYSAAEVARAVAEQQALSERSQP
jgi:hypothetical protein